MKPNVRNACELATPAQQSPQTAPMQYTAPMLEDVLHNAGIDRSDAEILLSFVLGKPRSWILAHPEATLSEKEQKQFAFLVDRRKNHEPIAYILGEKEFYGRKFFADKRVLIPRPSTEMLIDEAKRLWKCFETPLAKLGAPQHDISITPADSGIVIFSHRKASNVTSLPLTPYPLLVDVGTGSGCIGITLALELPETKILCTDISDDVLDVARENAKRHNVLNRVEFLKASHLPKKLKTKNYKQETYLVVSNPPYIPEVDAARHFRAQPLPPDVINFEPHEALFGGIEGMDVLEPLYQGCMRDPQCRGCILECRLEQAKKLRAQS